MFEFIQGNTTAINSIAAVILVLFLHIMQEHCLKYILEATERQSKLSLDPVIGITIKKIKFQKFGQKRKRRSMTVELN